MDRTRHQVRQWKDLTGFSSGRAIFMKAGRLNGRYIDER